MNSHTRRNIAKLIAEKSLLSQSLKNSNKAAWYNVRKENLTDEVYVKFVQMSLDKDTEQFLDDSTEQSDNLITQLWQSAVSTVLNVFMTKTSINGLLRRGSMFVFSLEQIRKLLNITYFASGSSLVDLGAGDGATTEKYTPFVNHVYVTEKSGPMIRILSQKGFRLLNTETWWNHKEKFDIVSCLNLLDRCSEPINLLNNIKKSLKSNGRVIIALVLPYKPYDEFKSAVPDEKLPITGETFEEQVSSTIANVFEPSGFNVLCWTKLPYLCEGDLNQDYYWLHDAVFILSV
ncbi:protein-L-histidine N-pros-methyltransferase [Daktulosphaira vitifoliae]|uniref:protein-L-histidine N-pros-methyltransferase n=1 Tax=Daktulosphaira vitifoliae TaxID=58002 RepID=UPI0021AA83F2|nr:protein-L-histidine N-pros-methyltransferase [Daktulosphaira vitifoliae]XP_050543122.1 protein-L-histidine N-pros-methyltransferase [Daktulosphaira vitifoliae]